MERRRSAASTLARLAEKGADRFDPARFYYIASLVRRATEKNTSVRQRLEEKALNAIDDYQKRYKSARREAVHDTARIAEKHPDRIEQARRHLDQCDFHGVRRMAKRIDRDMETSALSKLNDQMAMAGRLANEQATQFSLDALLQRQEEAVIASFASPPDGQCAPISVTDKRFRAFHFLETSWAKHHAETLVTHAINHVPENPGHLNSQMLVTRCLCAMRKLAPAYLRRWVSHMETLLWIEGAGREEPSYPPKLRQKDQPYRRARSL